MALVEFEAISFNLKFHLSAEAMATHRMLMPNELKLTGGPLPGAQRPHAGRPR
jgi:hypothetical protein